MGEQQILGTYCVRIGLTEPIERQLDDFRQTNIDRRASFPTPITIGGLGRPFQATKEQIEQAYKLLSSALQLDDLSYNFHRATLKYEGYPLPKIAYYQLIPGMTSFNLPSAVEGALSHSEITPERTSRFNLILADSLEKTRHDCFDLDEKLLRNPPRILQSLPALRLHIHKCNNPTTPPYNWPVIHKIPVSNSADAQLA